MFSSFFQFFHKPCLQLGRYAATGLVAACLVVPAVQAQGLASEPEFVQGARQWVNQSVAALAASPSSRLRLEVSVGSLDSRLQLAPCGRVEPYMPPGSRLWGRTRIGLRCMDGVSKWNVFLPVTVKAYGKAWVIKGNLPAGTALAAADVMEAEVDWAEDAVNAVLGDPAQWLGQTTTRSLMTGQALRQGMVRPPQVFQAGAQVRVVAQGPGFEITADGQAMSAGIVGQPARVRMDNGRVMSGVVLDTRTVKLEL
jgi:flagella basal body P-ring formation protein FlgA